jgi:precorrin-2 dehydrogenase/sirohydrochlorin ferrochelatase
MIAPLMDDEHLFPLFMRLRDRDVVVIGGGAVAERKVRSLLECGATVTVVAPEIPEALSDKVKHVPRRYRPGDLRGATLAFVAVDDEEASRAASREAQDLGIPVNVADQPDLCTFYLPALLRRGPMAIAISTGGASPAWAGRIKEDLATAFGEEYTRLFEALRLVRERCLDIIPDPERRREALLRLVDPSLVEMARTLQPEELARRILGRMEGD